MEKTTGQNKKKKTLTVLLTVLLVLLLSAGGWYLYLAYNPDIDLSRSQSSRNSEENYHSELIMIAFAEPVPMADTVRQRLREVGDWNDGIASDLMYNYDNTQPRDIRVYGEIKDGKMTLGYAGYVTGKDGQRIDYKNEKTFDFVLPLNPLFSKPDATDVFAQ